MSWHFKISLVKSIVRMAGCVASIHSHTWQIAVEALFVAEAIGILEEVFEGE